MLAFIAILIVACVTAFQLRSGVAELVVVNPDLPSTYPEYRTMMTYDGVPITSTSTPRSSIRKIVDVTSNVAENFIEASHKNKGKIDKIPVFSLNVLAPLATMCLLPLMYYKLVPKVGTLIGGILYFGVTCVGIIEGS